jgi:hypothetical protein
MSDLAIREALLALEDKEGRLSAERVVAAAKKRSSPLHGCFNWDDTEAARQYRLDQARTLIRTIKIEVRTEHTTVRTVAYVRDPELAPRVQGYRALARVQRDADVSREVVAAEFVRAASHLKRARDLASVLATKQEIEDLLERLGILQDHFERPDPDGPPAHPH